jgi:hypothetical protein
VFRCLLCGIQGDDGDFGGTVEAEGQTYGTDTAVDVELHLVEAVIAFRILFCHRRQDEWADEGEPDLAAMGMTREHEIDERTAGVADDLVSEVGFVSHEDDGAVGFCGHSEIELGVAGARVVDAAEPEAGSFTLDWKMLIDQNGSAVSREGGDDDWGAEGDVVVTEDGVAKRSGKGGKDLGTAADGVAASDEGERTVGDEVAREENEVRGESVNFVDDALKEKRLGVLVEVDVADLDDAVAVEGSREIGDGDGTVDDVDLMASDLAGVESQTCGGGARTYQKASPREA